jgi:hypothetical protein
VRTNRKPIQELCAGVAKKMGHTLGLFRSHRRGIGGQVKTAMCTECLGCCWVSVTSDGSFRAGGRLLKYQCGTKEAKGVL